MACNESFWVNFHAQWWGCDKQRIGGPGFVLEIQDENLWQSLGDLDTSRGRIFVRHEYEHIYERMCYGYEKRHREDFYGAIITGQPGIGTLYRFTS